MKKLLFTTLLCILVGFVMNAQNRIKETFDSNSFDWTESDYAGRHNGTAVIEKGKMTVKSKGEGGIFFTLLFGSSTSTFFETHCYAPLDVQKSFTIRAAVRIAKLRYKNGTGLIFNYKDDGNFSAFVLNREQVEYIRYEDGRLVGSMTQSLKWKDRSKVDQEWVVAYDGNRLQFFIGELEIMDIRYVEMNYAGVGFYTYDKQKLTINEVEFIQ